MRSDARLEQADVTIDDEFWSPRLQANDTATVDHIYQQLVESGRIENLRRAAKGVGEDAELARKQRMYRDESDVYKWIEAASYALTRRSRPELRTKLDYLVSLIESAQEDDGYLNSYFSLHAPEKRWTDFTTMHELYVAGHLFEAAVAHHNATGKSRLLDVATDFADHIYEELFERAVAPGHQEVELALIRLYDQTEDSRYLELAQKFLNMRGRADSPFEREMSTRESTLCSEEIYQEYRELLFDDTGAYDGKHIQDHRPVRDQSTAVGHSVRAVYMYCAMADIARETKDDELETAVKRIWKNTVRGRVYLTGGLGNYHKNEGFTRDFDLPTDTAYAETCASVGSVLWNHRMLQLTGKGKYGDLLERTLYNGVLAGVSLDGTRFFYTNPLASDGDRHPLTHVSDVRFTLSRREWYDTPCCPPNVARLLGSLEKYIYSLHEGNLSVELYIGGSGRFVVDDSHVQVYQETSYPWDDTVEIRLSPSDPLEFCLRPRIPAWCSAPEISVNGDTVSPEINDGHAELRRVWREGDTVEIELPMEVIQIEAHPDVASTAGRVALKRGPIVYCFEGVDNDVQLDRACLRESAEFETEFQPGPVAETLVVRTNAVHLGEAARDSLYGPRAPADRKPVTLTAIPYYLWANRGQSEMRVWMKKCGCRRSTD